MSVRYKRSARDAVQHWWASLKIGAGKAALLFVWAWMKLHLQVYRGTVRHSDVKERRDKVWLLRHGAHHLQCHSIFFQVVHEWLKVWLQSFYRLFFFFISKCNLWNRSWARWRTVVAPGYIPKHLLQCYVYLRPWALVTVLCVLTSLSTSYSVMCTYIPKH